MTNRSERRDQALVVPPIPYLEGITDLEEMFQALIANERDLLKSRLIGPNLSEAQENAELRRILLGLAATEEEKFREMNPAQMRMFFALRLRDISNVSNTVDQGSN